MITQQGIYRAKKMDGALGFTKGGADQAAVLFQTETGDLITWYGYFTEKTTQQTCEVLGKLGVAPDLSNIAGPSDVDVSLVIRMKPTEDGSGEQPEVRFVNFGDGIAMKNRMGDGERARLAQRVGGLIAKFGTAASNGASSRQPPRDDNRDGDEIPF